MEYNKTIQAMAPGDEVEGYYILKSANPKVAANGKPFLTGALSDRTGTVELKVWDFSGLSFFFLIRMRCRQRKNSLRNIRRRQC